ncbi:hypothetical protein CAPTEDRAFT_223991 [Capitella teleta]|uniref:GST N-terminal domain-containing protein n=1 Tax=Capitella teleta TaxID=283909 RepID=R7THI9_CAPTE|nr:hypothetical protein CAPTEDRAFT_223991 [Capitella teleta]|eukprot:ELT93184.1 hypothetical protein CAPTEDRAFT_223991 [Capitella teleta]
MASTRRQSCPQWTLFADKNTRSDDTPRVYIVRLSAPCRAVWMYMLQHSIPHTVIDVDFTDGEHAKEFKGRVPHEEVPVLVDGEVVVFQSPAILCYLAKHYTNHLGFGLTTKDQMNVESLLSWANADFHRVVGYSYAYPTALDKYRLPDEEANEILVEHGLSQLARHLERLEKNYLKSQKFIAGDFPSVADSFVATVLVQAEWTGLDLKMYPRVTKWLTKVKKVPYWSQVHMEHDHVSHNYNLTNVLRASLFFEAPLSIVNFKDAQQFSKKKGKLVVFLWCPSYVGILGDEVADRLTKQALVMPVTDLPLSHSDFKYPICSIVKSFWQSEWDDETENKLHSVQPVISERNKGIRKDRREEIVLTSARIGHSHLTVISCEGRWIHSASPVRTP